MSSHHTGPDIHTIAFGFPASKIPRGALAGGAQRTERGLQTKGLPVCGPGPQSGPSERQPHVDVSLPLFSFSLPSPLSKNK